MAKQWIEQLAEEIRHKNTEAAEEYGRKEHYASVIAARGKEFFVALVFCLKENIDTLRRQLQGEAVAAEMALENGKPDEARIRRARFPWVDARLTHSDDTITLDYAKDQGLRGDPQMDRKTCAFAFRVTADDTLFAEEAYVGPAKQFRQPEDLARHITETLFTPTS